MIVRYMEPGDLQRLAARLPEETQDVTGIAEIALNDGLSWAAVDGNDVLACAGLIRMQVGVAEAWAAIPADLSKRDLIEIAVRIYEWLPEVMDKAGLHRVQAVIRADFTAAKRFAERAGFIHEGPLWAYTPEKHDCIRMVRVRV